MPGSTSTWKSHPVLQEQLLLLYARRFGVHPARRLDHLVAAMPGLVTPPLCALTARVTVPSEACPALTFVHLQFSSSCTNDRSIVMATCSWCVFNFSKSPHFSLDMIEL